MAVCGLKFCVVLTAVHQILTIVEHVRIAIVGERVDGAIPCQDTLAEDREHVIPLNFVEGIIRHWFQVTGSHQVSGPACREGDHIELARPSFISGDQLDEQIAKSELLQFDRGPGFFCPGSTKIEDGLADGRSRLRGNDDGHALIRFTILCHRGGSNANHEDSDNKE